MVNAVFYFATETDQRGPLDYLGEPGEVSLHPWPVVATPPLSLSRDQALSASRDVMVVHRDLGMPAVIRLGDTAMDDGTKAALFNRFNWDRLRPASGEGLVDSNASPVLLWSPAETEEATLRFSSIGSQADAMRTVSTGYERWVNRVAGRVRRKGTKIWGLEQARARPDLDIRLQILNTVYALPDAYSALLHGTPGRR